MKKQMIGIFAILLTFLIVSPTTSFASVDQTLEKPYIQKGQINLQGVDLNVTDNVLKVGGNNKAAIHKLQKEIEKSPNLLFELKEAVRNDIVPIAIGYSIVYLKEVMEPNGDSHLEPFSEIEMKSAPVIGPTSSKGNLRLYTMVTRNSTTTLTAKSVFQWVVKYATSTNRQAPGDDLISITAPSKLNHASDAFLAYLNVSGAGLPSSNYWKEDQGYTTVVYGFREYVSGVFSVERGSLSMVCTGSNSGTVTCISKYVHTWSSANISISIGVSGASFGISPTMNAWQLASSVSL